MNFNNTSGYSLILKSKELLHRDVVTTQRHEGKHFTTQINEKREQTWSSCVSVFSDEF